MKYSPKPLKMESTFGQQDFSDVRRISIGVRAFVQPIPLFTIRVFPRQSRHQGCLVLARILLKLSRILLIAVDFNNWFYFDLATEAYGLFGDPTQIIQYLTNFDLTISK